MNLLTAIIFSLPVYSAQSQDSSAIWLDWIMLKDVKIVRLAERDSVILASSVQKANNKTVLISGFLLPPNDRDENIEYELTEESHLSCLHTDDDHLIKLHLVFKKPEVLQFTPVWIKGQLVIDRRNVGVVRLVIEQAEIIQRPD